MKRDELEKLIGGYASNTLSEQERKALFEAALTDQALFDALAQEEAVKEVFEDAHCRRRLVDALEEEPRTAAGRLAAWWTRPRAWALAGAAAATVVFAVVMVRSGSEQQTTLMAKRTVVEAPAAAPAPQQAPERQRIKAEGAPPPMEARREAKRLDAPKREFVAPVAKQKAEAQLSPPEPLPPPPAIATGLIVPGAAPGAAVPPPSSPSLRSNLAESIVVTDSVVVAQALTAADLYQLGQVQAENAARSRFASGQAAGVVAGAPSQPVGMNARALGLRYTVLGKRAGEASAKTTAAAIVADRPAQLKIETNDFGYLYVLAGDRTVFSVRARPRAPYLVDLPPGQAKVRIALSRRPAATPVQLSPGAGQLVQAVGAERYVVNSDPSADAAVVVDIAPAQR